jgi:hypothetical protein
VVITQAKESDMANFIAAATANSHGQFAAKAKRAGMSTQAYASQEEHAPGKLGKQARLAEVLMHASHKLYKGGNHTTKGS